GAVDEVVDLEARGRGAAVLDLQLLDGLDVVGLADRIPGSPRVLGKEREVSPDVPYQLSGRVKLRRKYVRDGREYFAREGAILVLAVLGDVIRVAAHPVFPVRPGVSLVGPKFLAVALFDVFEEIHERCVMQLRVSVFTVPGLDQRGGAGNEGSVLRLRAVNQR